MVNTDALGVVATFVAVFTNSCSSFFCRRCFYLCSICVTAAFSATAADVAAVAMLLFLQLSLFLLLLE
jgi:hypothetical protein